MNKSYNVIFFFFKQKTAYEMRISDWSSDVCPRARPAAWTSPATATPAAPSTIQRSPIAIRRIARAISTSDTVSISSITARHTGKVTDPGSTAPVEASDRVSRSGVATIAPARIESRMQVDASGQTPTMRVRGLSVLIAAPTPPPSPPPPTDRKSAVLGKRGSVSVDVGCGRIHQKKKKKKQT